MPWHPMPFTLPAPRCCVGAMQAYQPVFLGSCVLRPFGPVMCACLCCLHGLKVLDGELAQRAEATRKLREVQKQLMLLGGLVPPSPVVTAAAVAAVKERGAGSHATRSEPGSTTPGPTEESALHREAKQLQEAINKHSDSIKVKTV